MFCGYTTPRYQVSVYRTIGPSGYFVGSDFCFNHQYIVLMNATLIITRGVIGSFFHVVNRNSVNFAMVQCITHLWLISMCHNIFI